MAKENTFVAEANRLYKLLKKADKDGETFERYAYNQLNSLIKSVGKRTFNTRGLTSSQKMVFENAAKKFLKSKTSTISGAKETYDSKRQRWVNQIRTSRNFNSENFEIYEKYFINLEKAGYFEEIGVSPDFDYLMQTINTYMLNSDERLSKIMSNRGSSDLEEFLRSALKEKKLSEEDDISMDSSIPKYLVDETTGEVAEKGSELYEALSELLAAGKGGIYIP